MDKPDDNSHPQNIQNKLKRSHDGRTPSIDALRPPKHQRTDNGQEGEGPAAANTRRCHARRPDVEVIVIDSDSDEIETLDGPRLDNADRTNLSGKDSTRQSPDIVYVKSVVGRGRPEHIIANAGTRRSHTQAPTQVHTPSHARSPHAAVPTDVKQTNAFFQDANGVNISGNPSFHNQNISGVNNFYGGGSDGLDNLNGFISLEAQFDSSAQDPGRKCHPGTRENVLKRLRDWVDDPKTKERIFWLYSPAGAGKSAIAQTIARSYARPKVAGTFFFFRSDVNRNDGNLLFTTLAYQLAHSMPEIKEYIAHSLSERPDLPSTDVETQFDQLLARPFHVLSDDSTPQLTPAVHIDIVKKYQELAPVIIIDGVDECTDENVQRRFLKIIGDAVADNHFPLRFLIVSRPEVHIEQTIRRFQTPILTIDLADLDDANRDIEKYLVDEFSRIASEQDLDPTWPGPNVIRDIVYKSSGNFIYASVVIRFVGDPYCFAKTQLEIVLNMKSPKTMSPFAILDQLFLEILRRVPDQEFLQRYLTLLVARISVPSKYGELYYDDAVLMYVSVQELHANLRRMRSLLKFEPGIDVHHKSFLDFLHDSSRSGQYHIRKQGGIRGYLDAFVDSLVRYASAVIEQPNPHNTPHFAPRFRMKIQDYPIEIRLPFEEWQEVTQPLLDLQDKLLQLPNFAYARDLLPCDECTVFHLLRELLHIGLHPGIFKGQDSNVFIRSATNAENRSGVVSSTTTKRNTNKNDLDSLLISLFARYPTTMRNWLPTNKVIKLLSAILRFDCAETARRVRFISDAQKLIDILYHLIHEKNVLGRIHPDAVHKATLLALEIFARVPMFPLSLLSKGIKKSHHNAWRYESMPVEVLAQTIFASKILDYRYIAPLLVVEGGTGCNGDLNEISMKEWRKEIIPSPVTAIQIMLGLAKAIQYFHSMGVVLHREFGSANVVLTPRLRPKICCLCSTSQFLLEQQYEVFFSPADNIFSFGCIFNELITDGQSVPEIPDYAWQLIQRCRTYDLGSRPIIDEVVEEMESWTIE